MEAETKSHAADARHKDREARALEAQSADLSRQVKLLLHEVAELKQPDRGCAPACRAPPWTPPRW